MTKLQDDVLMEPGKDYPGILRREIPSEEFGFDEGRYTFTETVHQTAGKRNPHVFCGDFITVTHWADGSLHPNFRPKRIGGKGFNLESYAFGVACELREALKGFIEEEV